MKFSFGKNWQDFSSRALDARKVEQSRAHFLKLFHGIPLQGLSFLDIGFGQGLILCIAQESGAPARGIDVDPLNQGAIQATSRFFNLAQPPRAETASILDRKAVAQMNSGGYDIVHSWGVLHHTGRMYTAIANAASLVGPKGFFVIAVYNRHLSSPLWWGIKWAYNHVPAPIQKLLVALAYPASRLRAWMLDRGNPSPVSRVNERGMDFHYDLIDWLGGFPYEYASIREITEYVTSLGFELVRAIPTHGWTGCNEFVFRRKGNAASP